MGAFICKQPNGLYCRFSSVVDCPTDWGMTAEDYIELCAERAREEARMVLENRLKPFEWVIENYYPHSMTLDEYEKFLKEAGYENVDAAMEKIRNEVKEREEEIQFYANTQNQ